MQDDILSQRGGSKAVEEDAGDVSNSALLVTVVEHDFLDQLEKSNYFSTLDLASGFWQIRVHQNSQEKTAFSTPQELFQF